MGLGLIGGEYTQQAQARLTDTTAIARLIQEPKIVVVTKDSPFQTLDDLVRVWRADPRAVTLGGGSAPGGPDHLATMFLAEGIGVSPREARYVHYDGGGSLLAAILGQQVSVGISGLS